MIIDPAKISGREAYFLMIGTIVPRPIAWVSTRSAEGVDNLAPFSFFNGVTSNPPILSLAIGHRRWKGELVKKDTLKNIEATGEFVVHVSTEALAEAINRSSAEFPPEVSELEELELTTVASDLVAPLRIRESPVAMECRLVSVTMVGHEPGTGLVLGEVVRFHVDESVWDAENHRVDAQKLAPIARLGGKDWTRGLDVFSQDRPVWRADADADSGADG